MTLKAENAPRVVVSLRGGLGNQMFQYAAGLALSRRIHASLAMDASWYEGEFRRTGETPRTLELTAFSVVGDIIASPAPSRYRRLLQAPLGYRILNEGRFDPSRFRRVRVRKQVRLIGYWQDIGYFDDVLPELRKHFVLTDEFVGGLSTSFIETAEQIADEPTIGVHVRRGDYVHDPRTRAYHGYCDQEYFKQGVDEIRRATGARKAMVFSDDPEWCAENLDLPIAVTHVVRDEHSSAADLTLLSLCRHFVLSNSSFSLWAALLRSQNDGTVVAPRRWLLSKEGGPPLPASWRLL